MLRDGAMTHGRGSIQEANRAAAAWVEGFAARGYGPGGGHKLLADEARLVASAAEALRDVPGEAPLAPYRGLAHRVQAEAGDQATLAVLWTAGIVRRVLDERPGTAQLRAIIDGLVLARRQARGWWDAHSAPGDVVTALATVAGDGPALFQGATGLVARGALDLDRIDVVAGPVDAPRWSAGLRITPDVPRAAHGAILLVADAGLPRPRTQATVHGSRVDAMDFEAMAADAARSRLQGIGIVLLACRGEVPEALAGRLRQAGIMVLSHVPADLAHRIFLATGAEEQPHWQHAKTDDIGHGRIRPRHPRRGGALLSGDGPVATFEVPDGPMAGVRVAAVERWLRAAGHVWDDPRTLPGGGQWQRRLATHLRDTASLAPGRSAIGMETAAEALDAAADALMRNLGHDPLDTPTVDGVVDPGRCVVVAGSAALDAAIDILRVDAVHSRRASQPADLRGGEGPSGSPKGMPGDIPPLM